MRNRENRNSKLKTKPEVRSREIKREGPYLEQPPLEATILGQAVHCDDNGKRSKDDDNNNSNNNSSNKEKNTRIH